MGTKKSNYGAFGAGFGAPVSLPQPWWVGGCGWLSASSRPAFVPGVALSYFPPATDCLDNLYIDASSSGLKLPPNEDQSGLIKLLVILMMPQPYLAGSCWVSPS